MVAPYGVEDNEIDPIHTCQPVGAETPPYATIVPTGNCASVPDEPVSPFCHFKNCKKIDKTKSIKTWT